MGSKLEYPGSVNLIISVGEGFMVNLTILNNIIKINIASIHHLSSKLLITGDILQNTWLNINGIGR